MTEGAAPGARELDETPTWAVAFVCAAIVLISILLEKLLHIVGEWFEHKHKPGLSEALEKIKGELMVLGFISLLLTFFQKYISLVCIPMDYANTMLPCLPKELREVHNEPSAAEHPKAEEAGEHLRRLLGFERRFLSGGEDSITACPEGHVPLISANGLHQLHIFIFFLAAFHVIYSGLTMMLGRLKIREWKEWERQCLKDQDAMNDPNRFRLTHETSFVKEHNNFWTKSPLFFYFVCFFRQFFRSVRKADYLSMRHGFITVHLAPGTKFDFQKYIKRSLEDDFKRVVGISPLLWAFVVLFLLFNVRGWHTMLWISLLPLVVILAVGTKLQAIITEMALEIQERHAVVQGIPIVEVSDRHFWFSWPELVLYLIHFVLFQNAFEITYFFWIWYEFGLDSCFHQDGLMMFRVAVGLFFCCLVTAMVVSIVRTEVVRLIELIRVLFRVDRVGAQFLCSYITLPLYALVTQMGSTMKQSIFDEQTSKALKQWHKKAMKRVASGKQQTQTRTLGRVASDVSDSTPGSPQVQNGPRHRKVPSDLSDVELESASPAAPQAANIRATVDRGGAGHLDLLS